MFRILYIIFGGFLVLNAVAQDPLKASVSSQQSDNYDVNDEPQHVETYKTVKKSYKTVNKYYSKDISYTGGCTAHPVVPINGNLSCSSHNGCRAACFEGYRFPNGEREIAIACYNKEWKVQGVNYDLALQCEPICLPECTNNGICIAPNQCNCQENFSGPQCQFENKPCLNLPPLISNAQRKCNSKTCTVTCLNHFVFPDGSSVANLVCKHGNWEPTRKDWVTVPDCLPVCSPACQNGGICLPLNVCQCPKDFRGPQCQYRADACTGDKLGFNGGYQCNTIDENSYACTLICPSGIEFEFPPATQYICKYERGSFEPQPIPQCKIQTGSIVSVEKTSYMQTINRSWSLHSSGSFEAYKSSSMNMGFSGSVDGVKQTFDHVTDLESSKIEKKAEAATCFTWAGVHYKTFDGAIFSFDSSCAYTILKDARDGLFTITVQNDPICKNKTANFCSRIVHIYIQGKEYSLISNAAGLPEFRGMKKALQIPTQLPHLRVEFTNGGRSLLVSLDAVGLKIVWDGKSTLQLEASESLWNRTSGLCGNMNGEREDDFGLNFNSPIHFANSWKIQDIGEKCEEYLDHEKSCATNSLIEREAEDFCKKLLLDTRFKNCAKLIHPSEFKAACQWDYCSCGYDDRRKCSCETMSVFVRQCAHKGLVSLVGWRDINICPIDCNNGTVYSSCGPKYQPSCGADQFIQQSESNELENCEEGCFCPSGTVFHESRCIAPDDCPCRLRGKSFKPGASVPKECNTCVCSKGQWTCTETKCAARCSAVGDPHYTTFDGKKYDFMGKCTYYLLKGDNYSIEADNSICSSAISEMMGFERTFEDGEPSCTKSVTIRLNDVVIKLKQNRQILVNGEDVTNLPMLASGARVRIVSSIFISIQLPNELEVLWDGVSRVYVNAPAHFQGKTKGLCGTFTWNQKDDFLTPDGDVEQSIAAFANKWKTNEQCLDVKKDSEHPCDLNPQKRAAAEKYCSTLKKKIFLSCHWHVDPEPFYKDCIYDMCACEASVETCLCPTLAAYAKDCAQADVIVPWRQDVQECRIHCPGDQEYQMCGSSCARSCADISFNHDCKEDCVEGCNCPKGYTLNVNGECIPISQCPCPYGEIEFLPGYKEVRPGTKGQELCVCAGGKWKCQLATPDEINDYPAIDLLKSQCSAIKHLEVTTCEPAEPRTCRNMHKQLHQSPAICRPGCICKPGYVLDSPTGKCVQEEMCPCYHGGQSYKEGSIMQEECNTCKCSEGRWNCTDIICPGVCSVWGDSHYKTFDDQEYDFQGVCDYVLAKGKLSEVESFDVLIRSIACGTTGVTCSKSITLSIGKSNGDKESITLTRGKSLDNHVSKSLERIVVRRAGLFIFLDVPDLGLVVQWDEGTRVYVRVDAKWKGRTKGLCGDFNDNAKDDFKTPSGGVPEVSANLFGDSWKMSELCADPTNIKPDTCAKHPERKLWATQRCRIMKSELFQPCHSEIEPESYIERCIYDACGCDDGGDCECLCTAIAAYAHECNARGVRIRWRSQKLCPMQCDETCSSYSPCISTCPRESCDNLATLSNSMHLCEQDTCVEGCLPKPCLEGHIYINSSHSECIPRSECRLLCQVINGTNYYEGDKIQEDECSTCFCSRGKTVCKGTPCTRTTIESEMKEQTKTCQSGWTRWINRDLPKEVGFRSDIEELPSLIELLSVDGSPVCAKEKMVDIQCRTADTKIPYKELGLNIECSIDHGLFCIPSKKLGIACPDFEIRVLCRCEDPPTTPMAIVDACNLSEPYKIVPENCHEYLQCGPGLKGNEWVRKVCGADMMFNEKLQVCDWPTNVAVVRPDCLQTKWQNKTVTQVETVVAESKSICKNDEHWSDCAIKCSKTCEYYNYKLTKEGICNETIDCIPGCVSSTRTECLSNNYYWRDFNTCVDRSHCTCKSQNGTSVTPGTVINVSKCSSCQCINNFYTCDKSECEIDDEIETIFHKNDTVYNNHLEVIIVPNTVNPPRECESGNYVWLIENSPFDVKFSASSFESILITSDLIRLRRTTSMTTWKPSSNDDQQYVEVILDKSKPIYGIIVKGDAIEDKFVTSYKIMFSEDGQFFSYITKSETKDSQEPKIFRGPIDSRKPVRQIFHPPIEAKVIRVNPLTWHNGIAMQMELLACDNSETTTTMATPITTTPIITETVIDPICDDAMGYNDGFMSNKQVSVSSSFFETSNPNLRLSSIEIWRPHLDNPDQFVQFDFLGPRNLTGIETKGGNGIWTSAYTVYYSIDSEHWNPIIDDTGNVKEFLGNVDDYNSKVNYFIRPIGARYLRIFPTKWNRHIGLKVEIHGCYEPYPSIDLPIFMPPPIVSCNVCPGIVFNQTNECRCEGSLWWDGRFCVAKKECPCVAGHLTYTVGSSFETADCKHCLCALGGIADCQPKICPICASPDHRPVVTQLCTCLCKPCPVGTRLCSTSNVCIDENKWCNGIQDCPDDEANCLIVGKTEVKKETSIKIECHTTCPPGFVMETETAKDSYDKAHSIGVNYNFSIHKTETIKTSFTKQIIRTKVPGSPTFHSRMGEDTDDQLCPKIICKPIIDKEKIVESKCEKIVCPEGFQPKYDQSKSYRKTKICDNSCIPIPSKERVCTVIGRTFTTFDKLEYKYDICNHILARDRDANRWYIVAEKVCKTQSLSCIKTLVVTFDEHVVMLHPDMYAIIDGHLYSQSEIKHFGDKNPAMKLSRVGNALRIESRHYPMWALLESSGSVKIGVSEELAGHVDGMCGFLDGLSINDQQTPEGKDAKSSQEFGDSWRVLDSAECKLQVCPRETQMEAWKICTLLRDESFQACDKALNREKFVSSCLESSCACLSTGNITSQECRCKALSGFVAECLATDKTVELSNWRSIHDCPALCDAPFVHKDCFRNKCEMCCETIQEIDPCPVMDGLCVPGCFCPDGLVRNGDTCIPPSECRDCVCNSFGNSKYVTFDKSNVEFNGNCTYVLSRDVVVDVKGISGHHTYEIFVSNGLCDDRICTEAITILYQFHVVQIKKSNSSNELLVTIDEEYIYNYPYKNTWINVEETQAQDIKLLIYSIQLEIVSFKQNFAFMVRLPSHTFGGAMEGLCGNCNGKQEDDLKLENGKITDNIEEFGNDWLVKDAREHLNIDLSNQYCGSTPKKQCIDLLPANNYCELLLQDESFVRCHGLVDPTPYYFACKDTLCNNDNICGSFEAYARMCSVAGICINWRNRELCPYECPPYLEYRACNLGCPETCETINNDVNNNNVCTNNPIEGCFCPMDHVWHNDSCILKEKCFICDEEGHVDGDIWYPDKCTQCLCQNRRVQCQQSNCPAVKTICDQNANPVIIPGSENDCCPKYMCVPTTTILPTCTEQTQQPDCGFAQTLKVTIDANGCQKFICQCVPEEECTLLENETALENEILELGFVKEVNTSGCCPRISKVCKPETCPPSSQCQKYFKPVVSNTINSCCPKTECELPKDMCLYTLESQNELFDVENVIAKYVGEKWDDGKCKSCICEVKDGLSTVKCSTKECLNILNHPDAHDYLLKEVSLDDQCCPKIERIGCKDTNSYTYYKVGDSWHPDQNDVCVSTTCSDDINGVSKKTIIQECSETCELGFEYRKLADKSVICCGECIAVTCVVDGELKNIGDTWYSDDYCTTSSCISTNGSLHVHVSKETCEEIIDLTEQRNYKIEKRKINGKCCPEIVRIACLSDDGNSYHPGEIWKSPFDNCVFESCIQTAEGQIVKQIETKTCNTDCPKGWDYKLPDSETCCGECKQVYCVVDDVLYEPNKVWYSNDNCTSYSCLSKDNQLFVSISPPVCAELDCPPELVYNDGCCKRCNIINASKVEKPLCVAEEVDIKKTIGIFEEKKGIHGTCKNLKPVQGLTECHGHCNSSTYFDPYTWNQMVDCTCCQPVDYKKIYVELTCEDRKKFKKTLVVPSICACTKCSGDKQDSYEIEKPHIEVVKSYSRKNLRT